MVLQESPKPSSTAMHTQALSFLENRLIAQTSFERPRGKKIKNKKGNLV